MISMVILLSVFLLILLRQCLKIQIEIWQVMLLGACGVLFAKEISFCDAFKAVDWDVIIFLFGMFVCGSLFEISGYLSYIQHKIFGKAKNSEQALFLVIFFSGLLSSVVMNDTMAIVGVPVIIHLAKIFNVSLKPLILALAFSVTIGSVFSPIGNPQNLLIAMNSNLENPFVSFLKFLFLPTFINLLLLFLILMFAYKTEFKNSLIIKKHIPLPEKKKYLYFLSQLTMAIILLGIIAKIYFSLNHKEFRLTYIAIFASLPALLLSFKQIMILKKVDWKTLIFFIAMFVLMKSVWNRGFFQNLMLNMKIDLLSIPFIFLVSVILSQFISNVPLVALILPLMISKGALENHFLALASASTIAGNLSILGAASNVIIIQGIENRLKQSITFFEFFKVGLPLTIINCFVYWLFLR